MNKGAHERQKNTSGQSGIGAYRCFYKCNQKQKHRQKDVFTGVFILKNIFLGRSASRDGVITPFHRYEDSAEPGAVHRSPERRTRRRTRRRK